MVYWMYTLQSKDLKGDGAASFIDANVAGNYI